MAPIKNKGTHPKKETSIADLEHAEAKTQATIETAVVPIITINEFGIIESVNEATLKMFGYQLNELLGVNINILVPSPHKEHHDTYLKTYIQTGIKKIIGSGRELEAIKKDGSLIPIHLSVSEFHSQDKHYFVGIINDLSAIRTADEKLRVANRFLEEQSWMQEGQVCLYQILASDKKLIAIIEHVIIFLCDYMNIPVGLFYLYDSEIDIAKLSCGYRIPPQIESLEFKSGEGLVGQAISSRKIQYHKVDENSYLRLRTGLLDIPLNHVYTVPIFRGQQIVGVFEFACEKEILQNHYHFIENIIEPIAMSLLIKIKDETVKNLLEETRKQAVSLQVQQEDLKKANNELQDSEVQLKKQKEELKNINNELKHRTGALENEKDLLKEKTKELEEAQELLRTRSLEIEESSRYKSEFLANMSHELRTPLNSILMLSQSMAENRKHNLERKQVHNLETIHRAGTDLLNLINDILDLSKIESGKFEINYKIFRIDRFLDNLAHLMSPLAKSKGLKFKVHLAEDLPMTMESDSIRLEQILRNLLSNAIKFTDSGSVFVYVEEDRKDYIRFIVEDTGIGIPKNRLKSVFQAFQQLDGRSTRKFGGTGLGLSITKHLVALLGGHINLKSDLGKGSRFTVSLPMRDLSQKYPETAGELSVKTIEHEDKPKSHKIFLVPDQETKDDRYDLQLGDRVILIVEDDKPTCEILTECCHNMGYKVIVAADGINGVRLAEEIRPMGILLDLCLPRVDGFDVIDVLKTSALTQHIPILVISGAEFKQQALSKGALGYLAKPINVTHLKKYIQYMDNFLPRSKRLVLVIEDDDQDMNSIRDLLKNQYVEIIEASTGDEALEILRKNKPHCIILDIKLPDMMGWDFLSHFQKMDLFPRPPVIVNTAIELSQGDRNELEQYSNSIIIKGFKSKEKLLYESTIRLHLVEKKLSREQRKILSELRDPGHMLRGRKILVVDDDERNSLSLVEVLEDTGVSIITAKNGQEAIEIVRHHCQELDIVLMDMMMPIMDGYEATKLIKTFCFDLPVIALTAKAMKGEKEKCLLAGCDDYIAKPFNVQQLLSILRVWLYQSA